MVKRLAFCVLVLLMKEFKAESYKLFLLYLKVGKISDIARNKPSGSVVLN